MLTPPDPDRRPLDIVDGFVYSASQLYLPSRYRPNAFAQMETLRRAKSYRTLTRLIPDNSLDPIPQYSQLEQQVRVEPGTYLWGLLLSAGLGSGSYSGSESSIHVQITDACTKTPAASDYFLGTQLVPSFHHPAMLTQPRLIDDPGLLNVELYNRNAAPLFVQLALFFALPALLPWEVYRFLAPESNRGY